jgi:hypothetical protein
MKQSVSNDKDSVSIQIVIIEMDYKFNPYGNEFITNTDGINSDDSENKRTVPSFNSSGMKFLNAYDDWDFIDEDEDIW